MGMTREEAITVLKAFTENPLFSDVHKAAFNIAIHDIKRLHDWDINNLILINIDNYKLLEQEPFINKPCVSSSVCEHDKNKILDKIRAEIEQEPYISKMEVLDILDKYKAKSEDKEWTSRS